MLKKSGLIATSLSALLLAGGAQVAAQTNAQAEPLPAHEITTCELTGGQLSWGVKESFRSYISGGIARGSWETLEGASYATPNFTFVNGQGTADAAAGTSVSFAGAIHFTGHEGVLDMTMSNPTLKITGQDSAVLLFDMRSNDTSGALAVDEKQVELANVALSGVTSSDDNTITITAAPTTLTEAGAPAFGGFYDAGVALDPVTFTVTSGEGCAGVAFGQSYEHEDEAAATDNSEKKTPEVQTTSAEVANTGAPAWVWVVVAAVAVAIIAGGATALTARKKKSAAGAAAGGTAAAGAESAGAANVANASDNAVAEDADAADAAADNTEEES